MEGDHFGGSLAYTVYVRICRNTDSHIRTYALLKINFLDCTYGAIQNICCILSLHCIPLSNVPII